jgi:hypothetical protein
MGNYNNAIETLHNNKRRKWEEKWRVCPYEWVLSKFYPIIWAKINCIYNLWNFTKNDLIHYNKMENEREIVVL